jgi:hypothetical protein
MIKYFLRTPAGDYVKFKGSGGHTIATPCALGDATALPDEKHALDAAEHFVELWGEHAEIVRMAIHVPEEDE